MVQEFPGSIPHHLSPFRLVHADIVISSVSSLQYLFPFFSFISEILCAGTSLALGLPSTTSRSKCPSYIPSVFFIYHRNTSIRHLRWALKVHFLQQLPFKIQAHYCLLASYTAVRSRNNLTYWQWKATGPFFFNSDQSVNLRGSYTWYTFNHNHPISCNPAHHLIQVFLPKNLEPRVDLLKSHPLEPSSSQDTVSSVRIFRLESLAELLIFLFIFKSSCVLISNSALRFMLRCHFDHHFP